MTALPWPQRDPAPWRAHLATLLDRCARTLAPPPREPAPQPHIEFAHGVLYADGVRIGTLPVLRL